MKFTHCLPIFFITVSSIFLGRSSAYGFNLIVSPSVNVNYNKIEYTTWGGNKGKVWIDPITKIFPPSKKLSTLFKTQFTAYDFEVSNTPVYGDFIVQEYRSCPPGVCPEQLVVGGLLDLEYVPKTFFDPELGRDVNEFPDPNSGKVRWIQWVTSNHSANSSGAPRS